MVTKKMLAIQIGEVQRKLINGLLTPNTKGKYSNRELLNLLRLFYITRRRVPLTQTIKTP